MNDRKAVIEITEEGCSANFNGISTEHIVLGLAKVFNGMYENLSNEAYKSGIEALDEALFTLRK